MTTATWPTIALVISALAAGLVCTRSESGGGTAGAAGGSRAAGGAATVGGHGGPGGSQGGVSMAGAGQAGSGGGAAGHDASSDATADGNDAAPDATAGGGTGGTGGAAGAGGSPEAGGPGACAGLFCEDFESGAIDPNIWSLYQSGGQTVTVQKATVAHGKYAAQFHALPNLLSGDFIIAKNAPAALGGHHFGRAYVNVTPKPPDAHMLVLFAGSGAFPKAKYLELGSIHNGWQLSSQSLLGVNADGSAVNGSAEAYSPAGGAMPLGQWFCLEWELNDTPDQIRVFVNGAADYAYTNISFGGTTTGQVGGFTQFGFGYYVWHPASYAFDMYYDDIVLDTKRVGCLP